MPGMQEKIENRDPQKCRVHWLGDSFRVYKTLLMISYTGQAMGALADVISLADEIIRVKSRNCKP